MVPPPRAPPPPLQAGPHRLMPDVSRLLRRPSLHAPNNTTRPRTLQPRSREVADHIPVDLQAVPRSILLHAHPILQLLPAKPEPTLCQGKQEGAWYGSCPGLPRHTHFLDATMPSFLSSPALRACLSPSWMLQGCGQGQHIGMTAQQQPSTAAATQSTTLTAATPANAWQLAVQPPALPPHLFSACSFLRSMPSASRAWCSARSSTCCR